MFVYLNYKNELRSFVGSNESRRNFLHAGLPFYKILASVGCYCNRKRPFTTKGSKTLIDGFSFGITLQCLSCSQKPKIKSFNDPDGTNFHLVIKKAIPSFVVF